MCAWKWWSLLCYFSSETRRWSGTSYGRTSENFIFLQRAQRPTTQFGDISLRYTGSASNRHGSFLRHVWANFRLLYFKFFKFLYVTIFYIVLLRLRSGSMCGNCVTFCADRQSVVLSLLWLNSDILWILLWPVTSTVTTLVSDLPRQHGGSMRSVSQQHCYCHTRDAPVKPEGQDHPHNFCSVSDLL